VRLSRLIARSLAFHWRTGPAVAFGVAAATAAIAGSLLVGSSVKASVRTQLLARLGAVDHALPAPWFFREGLGGEVASCPGVRRVDAVLLARGAVRNAASGGTVPDTGIVGVDAGLWGFFPGSPAESLEGRTAAVSKALARDLGVAEGDAILVNVPRKGSAPLSTIFARRERAEFLGSMRLRVGRTLDGGAGSFALGGGGREPRNVFVAREWLAREIRAEGRANALLVESDGSPGTGAALQAALRAACVPADFGLTVSVSRKQHCVVLRSERLLLGQGQLAAARQAAADVGADAAVESVYLANSIERIGGGSIAYAIVAAGEAPLPLTAREGTAQPGDGEIVLNDWAAADLGARVGERLRITFYVPSREATDQTATEEFSLAGIVSTDSPGVDPDVVPEFEGMTETERISDWKPPFPVDLKRVTQRDEDYWTQHKAAPKAFVPVAVMTSIWASGQPAAPDWATAVRVVPRAGEDTEAVKARFEAALAARLDPAAEGMTFRPVRERAMAASEGTQDFGMLYASMSAFIVLAAMGLTAMMARLAAERRAAEAGVMLACGFSGRSVAAAIMGELGVLVAAGAAGGLPAGWLYARAMLAWLAGGWPGAEAQPLRVHADALRLAAGAAAGAACGMISVWWGARALGRQRVLDLLAGWRALGAVAARPGGRFEKLLAIVLLAAALALVGLGVAGAVPATAAFFGSGAILLVPGFIASRLALGRVLASRGGRLGLAVLSLRSAAANRGRSLLTIWLFAWASFIIIAAAANHRDYSAASLGRDSGAGGFALRATSSVPVPFDFGTPGGRAKLGFAKEDEAAFEGVRVVSMPMTGGDDISCASLSKPAAPRVLGVPEAMIERGGFDVDSPVRGGNAWALLDGGGPDEVPAFGDADSVRWALHSGLGGTIEVPRDGAPAARLRIAGLLRRSIFAGELLISEANFRRLFPREAQPRCFLIETPPGAEESTAFLLRNLGDMGLEVASTRELLDAVAGVQNLYISTFVALGGLGVLLGTFGLVAVLLRSAFERRSEFALMLAVGLGRGWIARLLVLEHAGLLAAGLACGTTAALLAVAPQIVSASTRVDWPLLAGLLASVLVVGVIASAAAAWAAARGNLIAALREE